MDLAAHQRKLLGLVRSTYQVCPEDDPYIQRVAQSKDLEEARRNIFLWRIYVLERACRLSFTLLKRRNLLEETLSGFITRYNISPFRETQGPALLEVLSSHYDNLIASVAQFELALMKVKHGDPCSYVVNWNVEPYSILNSLAKGIPMGDSVLEGAYRILISRDLPFLFKIVRENGDEDAAPAPGMTTRASSCAVATSRLKRHKV
jgi:hypothetical protein